MPETNRPNSREHRIPERTGSHNVETCPCPVCRTRRGEKKAVTQRAGSSDRPAYDQTGKAQAKPSIVGIDRSDPERPIITLASGSVRGKIAQWALLRHQGKTHQEIADTLGITRRTLSRYISKATKEGWLKIEDPADRLEHIIAPKVVDNIEHFIDARDKKMTIETAKGIGLFKSHQAVKVENDAPQMVLALKFENQGDSSPIIEGSIVGQPKLPKPPE